jgi:periplasmic protein CpxP/Spy
MNRFRSLTLATLLAGVVAAGAAYAQGPAPDGRGPGGRGPGGFGRGGGLPLRGLNLTDAQEQQVRTLTQQYREQNRAAGEKLRAAFDAQRNAVETVPVNEGLIRSTTQELAEAQTEAALQQARLHADIFALLTPEQQAQAKKLQAERQARRQRQTQQR